MADKTGEDPGDCEGTHCVDDLADHLQDVQLMDEGTPSLVPMVTLHVLPVLRRTVTEAGYMGIRHTPYVCVS